MPDLRKEIEEVMILTLKELQKKVKSNIPIPNRLVSILARAIADYIEQRYQKKEG